MDSGGKSERNNGNGSPMRILPLLFYLNSDYGSIIEVGKGEVFEIIGQVSSLTHAHKRSQIACGIYLSVTQAMDFWDKDKAFKWGLNRALNYYGAKQGYKNKLSHFSRLADENFKYLPEAEIRSSGYVLDNLEASLWCLLNSKNYRDCVLKAVNLGLDTDTTGAIEGGLAGLYYGYQDIPRDWLRVIVKRDYLENLCQDYYLSVIRRSLDRLMKHYSFLREIRGMKVSYWLYTKPEQGGSSRKGLPHYFNKFLAFKEDFYRSSFIDYDYVKNIKEKADLKTIGEIEIEKADLELCLALFMLILSMKVLMMALLTRH